MSLPTENTPAPRHSLLKSMAGLVAVCLPSAVLVAITWQAGETPQPILVGGVATSAFLAVALLHQVGPGRAFNHKSCSSLYLIAVLVLWMTSRHSPGWFIHAAMGTLLGVPLLLFICQEFLFTGRGGLRRARSLVRRLAARTEWPANLEDCKLLPEVKALREAIRDDAEPVMVLFMNPKPEVRIAAMAALEFRTTWKMGQAETVLKAAKYATEPPVRAAAMMALANVDDPDLVSHIAMYLRDATSEVRVAAAQALLWDADRRWSHIRTQLRAALSDYRCRGDGPLPSAGLLPPQAIADLMMWSGEAGSLGLRSTLTLRSHFQRELNENPTPELVDEICRRIRDGRCPSALRVELAHLLTGSDSVTPELWRSLLEAGQPSALRLLAAGALLQTDAQDQAIETLREVARIPNREMALQVAVIVQRSLRIDMGLPLGGELPEPQSRQATEIARRVLEWAAGNTPVVEPPPRRRRGLATGLQIPRPTGEQPWRRI